MKFMKYDDKVFNVNQLKNIHLLDGEMSMDFEKGCIKVPCSYEFYFRFADENKSKYLKLIFDHVIHFLNDDKTDFLDLDILYSHFFHTKH